MQPRHPCLCRLQLIVEPLEDRSLLSVSSLSAVTRTDPAPPPEQPIAREALPTPATEDASVKANAGDLKNDRPPVATPTRSTENNSGTGKEVVAPTTTLRPTNVTPIVMRRTPPPAQATPPASPNVPIVVPPPASVARTPQITTANVLPAVGVPSAGHGTTPAAVPAIVPLDAASAPPTLSESPERAVPSLDRGPTLLASAVPYVPVAPTDDSAPVEAITAALPLSPAAEPLSWEAGLSEVSGEFAPDLSSLTAALEAFLAGLSDFGQSLAGWPSASSLPYWALTAALAAAAGEAVRRQAMRRRTNEELPDCGLPGIWAADQV